MAAAAATSAGGRAPDARAGRLIDAALAVLRGALDERRDGGFHLTLLGIGAGSFEAAAPVQLRDAFARDAAEIVSDSAVAAREADGDSARAAADAEAMRMAG